MQQQHHKQSPESSAACEQPTQRSKEQICGRIASASAAEQRNRSEPLHKTASQPAATRSAGRAESVSAVRSSQHRSQQSVGLGPQAAAAASAAARLLNLVETSQEPLSLRPCEAADDREPGKPALTKQLHIEGSEQCSTTFRRSAAQSGTQAAGERPAGQHQRAAPPDKSVPQRQAPLRQRLEDWDLPPEVVKVSLLVNNPAYQPNALFTTLLQATKTSTQAATLYLNICLQLQPSRCRHSACTTPHHRSCVCKAG